VIESPSASISFVVPPIPGIDIFTVVPDVTGLIGIAPALIDAEHRAARSRRLH
jgi:hypothetical protein